MHRFEIAYTDADGQEALAYVRAESQEEAIASFTGRLPFTAESARDLGEDEDNGAPPVIGPN